MSTFRGLSGQNISKHLKLSLIDSHLHSWIQQPSLAIQQFRRAADASNTKICLLLCYYFLIQLRVLLTVP